MAGDNQVSIIGTIVADLELKTIQTPEGPRVVTNGRIATPAHRVRDANGNWADKEGTTIFMGFAAWGRDAENAVASLGQGRGKGTRVLVQGDMLGSSYPEKDQNGQPTGRMLTSTNIENAEVFVSTKFGVVNFQKSQSTQVPGAAAPVAQAGQGQQQMTQQGQFQQQSPQQLQQPQQGQFQQQFQQSAPQPQMQPAAPPQQMQQPVGQVSMPPGMDAKF